MFDGLFKSKFFSKCKLDIKATRTRIEMIKRKRNATQKFLRNDIGELLKNGFDHNAYGRAEGLIVELNRSQCYDLIDQYCECILNHISAMDKQRRECPEECREAASSLMFAAARFGDLPELRELRTIFSERYGKSLDYYVNKQFEEKLKSGVPSIEMKLQLMQDIAAESGLEWDSKALENNLFKPSSYNKKFAKESNDSEYPCDNNMNESSRKKGSIVTAYEFFPPKESNLESKMNNKFYEHRETSSNEGEDKPKYSWISPPYTKPVANKENDNVGPTGPDEPEENQQLGPEIAASSEGGEREKEKEKEKEKEMNKEKAAVAQRILRFFDGRPHPDEEEKILDRLLWRYSRKRGEHKKGKLESALKPTPQHESIDSDKAEKHMSRDGPNKVSSLPVESSGQMEAHQTRTRASSFLQDGKAHVHRKLPPDYDDFIARLAAYKGK